MKPQMMTHTLDELLSSNASVSSDGGITATRTARHVPRGGTMRFPLSGAPATMAIASTGAAWACPGRLVACIPRDGRRCIVISHEPPGPADKTSEQARLFPGVFFCRRRNAAGMVKASREDKVGEVSR